MHKDNTIETIHRYLLEDMSDDEKMTFEKDMASNEAIQNNLVMEKRFLNMLNLAADSQLKSTITAVHQDLKEKGVLHKLTAQEARVVQMKRRRASRMIFALAASLAVVMAAWFAFNTNNVDTESLYANNYKAENTMIDNYMSAGMVNATDLHRALDQYTLGEYEESKRMLTTLMKESPDEQAVPFYLALSHLGLNDVNSAIPLLERLASQPSDLQNTAKWYLGLAYVKIRNLSAAEDIFEELVQSRDTDFSGKAGTMLDELRN